MRGSDAVNVREGFPWGKARGPASAKATGFEVGDTLQARLGVKNIIGSPDCLHSRTQVYIPTHDPPCLYTVTLGASRLNPWRIRLLSTRRPTPPRCFESQTKAERAEVDARALS